VLVSPAPGQPGKLQFWHGDAPGRPAELISRFAADGGYDLVVLGHRGHFLRDHLLGSTADRVAEHAPCPVMIVR